MEPQLTIFDALSNTPQEASSSSGKALKAAGMAQVLENAGKPFTSLVGDVVKEVFAGQVVTAEQWRTACEERGIRPHHPNAWGSVTSAMRKRGLIREVDAKPVPAKSPKSRACMVPLWEVVA